MTTREPTVYKRRTVHYKRAVIGGSKETLQQILENALGAGGEFELAANRKEQVDPKDPTAGFHLINKSQHYESIFFGQFLLFEPGKTQALLTMNENAHSYQIDPITTASIKKRKGDKSGDKEFVESILYFGVYKNHVLIVQSAALRSKEFEQHLNNLLANNVDSTTGVKSIIFQEKPANSVVKKIESSPVKNVVLGKSPIESEEIQLNPVKDKTSLKSEQKRLESKTVQFKPSGIGSKILNSVLGDGWASKLDLEDSLDEANLQVKLEISYNRTTTGSGQFVLDSIATSLRDLDSDNVRVELKNGGVITGKELKLSESLNVQVYEGMISEDDLYLKMYKWLSGNILNGEVDNRGS
ncbi:hypothetical protein AB9Q29_016570 [Pantoea vagans]|uniref:hypothetical protein n=1 Tax=Pantoea vagans TaxID=470934 RepID=UPI00351462CD